MDDSKDKPKRGGRRKGAGRPKVYKDAEHQSHYLPPTTHEYIRTMRERLVHTAERWKKGKLY